MRNLSNVERFPESLGSVVNLGVSWQWNAGLAGIWMASLVAVIKYATAWSKSFWLVASAEKLTCGKDELLSNATLLVFSKFLLTGKTYDSYKKNSMLLHFQPIFFKNPV